MSLALERISPVVQTSMGSTRLPLELQQQVFSYLDPKSFHAARNVCEWWRFATIDAVTLSQQLRKLPIIPPVDAAQASPLELQELFLEVAYTLMLGLKIHRQPDSPGSLHTAAKMGFLPSSKILSTTNRSKVVAVYNRKIALFDTSGNEAVLLAQRPINDLQETIGNGPWLKVAPTSQELALSSDGRLLAIAQERTIQIYDLGAEPDSFTVNGYVASATGPFIIGLDFEQNNHVLRVQLSGKGTVVYLGTPCVESSSTKADIDHWKTKAGLKHPFLDSTLPRLDTASSNSVDQPQRLSGLQLLRPFHGGFLFAAQRHGGNESSHYILGHIACSILHHTTALIAEPNSIIILSRLESFLSAWTYTLNGLTQEGGVGLWENMPSAHEHHPRFALSADNTSLVVAERDKKAVRGRPLTQLFLYRLPGTPRISRTLRDGEKGRRSGWATLDRFLSKLEESESGKVADMDVDVKDASLARHRVARIPLCLTTIQGNVTDLGFEESAVGTGQKMLSFKVATEDVSREWMLEAVV